MTSLVILPDGESRLESKTLIRSLSLMTQLVYLKRIHDLEILKQLQIVISTP